MAGNSDVDQETLLPPRALICRQSSDVLAVDDGLVRRAVAYIRAHCRESIGVEQVAAALGTTRRTLERRFRAALDTQPSAELQSARLRLAKRLLATTERPVGHLASELGFATPQHFTAFFRKHAGCTPTAYRVSDARRDHA